MLPSLKKKLTIYGFPDLFLLNQAVTLSVNNIYRSRELRSLDSVTLVVDDINRSHTLDNTVVSQKHVLSINDLSRNHVLDAPQIIQRYVLTVNDLTRNQILQSCLLEQKHRIIVSDISRQHTLDSPSLFYANTILVVDDLSRSHALDHVTVYILMDMPIRNFICRGREYQG